MGQCPAKTLDKGKRNFLIFNSIIFIKILTLVIETTSPTSLRILLVKATFMVEIFGTKVVLGLLAKVEAKTTSLVNKVAGTQTTLNANFVGGLVI